MKIYGIGIGPGDPELLTVKAVRLMQESDVVVVPQSDKTGRSLAKDIIKDVISDEKIYMYYFPMTGNKADLDAKYAELAEQIAKMVKEGKKVSYVTIGDAPIYSTLNYLAHKLGLHGIKMEFVPGISAISAVPNILCLSVTEKDESFCTVEMKEDTAFLKECTEKFATVFVMKVHNKLDVLKKFVKENNIKTAYVISRATLADEIILNLNSDEQKDINYLSTAILKKGRA
ncbi:precorrin-2 C(20)-methyltransferase [Seleniivibrio woodruffii]|uniref:Precorrin-2/cobalt-factor-2 C20-methyltransferase n=1 Tax=Seleniivibrio woodruffii TaxID=1078050 RepID=A0A4R1KAH5_9BACT|nr:precorrin-2 C(20)-methyltransferase [Seleniivibrio woodruffii]TCK61040.1 precorrin-2/cobalt-factor-2 C20-methyltransferase [Seleniivibrio woodruffii]TVZ36668.1 precorrin-2/cobalt-factor-2 C20-methyltransferase [Seleniivibrio woodruffii]